MLWYILTFVGVFIFSMYALSPFIGGALLVLCSILIAMTLMRLIMGIVEFWCIKSDEG